MKDPVVTRLAGFAVFAGLLGALVVAGERTPTASPSAQVAAVEVQDAVERLVFTRP
jgi:hypothetical protein